MRIRHKVDIHRGYKQNLTLQIAVTPTLMDTTEDAKKRFTPIDRGCYNQGELPLKYLPSQFYRYLHTNQQVKVVSEPERIDVFLIRSCVQLTDISCGVVYEATLPSLVLFRNYR